jgi:HlyD family secretion protein
MIGAMRWLWVSVCALLSGCEKLEVAVVRVDVGPVESTVTSVEAGVVEPLHKSSLAAPVSGRIVRVHRSEGDRVGVGDVIVELENDTEKLHVDEATKELERLKQMKDLTATEEQIDRAEFAHRRAKIEYEKTFIRAAFPGVIAEMNARVGEMTFGSMAALSLGSATAGKEGSQHLIYVVDDSRLHVKADIDEADVSRVRPGQATKVTLGGGERRSIQGVVASISPVVSTREGETRTAEVKVDICSPDYPEPVATGTSAGATKDAGAGPVILVGMSADLEILVDRIESAVRIPTSAVLERGEEKYVFAVVDGKLERRRLTSGVGNWEMTEVRAGLSPGDLVVLPTDVKLLTDGREVRTVVTEARAASR